MYRGVILSKLKSSIQGYIDSFFPIIYLQTFEYRKADRLIKDLAEGRSIQEWNLANGWVDFDYKRPLAEYQELPVALEQFDVIEQLEKVFIVLKGISKILMDDQRSVAKILSIVHKMIDDRFEDVEATIFIVDPVIEIPVILEKFITIFEVPLPDESEIRKIMTEFINQVDEEVTESDFSELSLAFKGLSQLEIEQLLNLALHNGGGIDRNDKQLILNEKEQIINKGGILEMVPFHYSIEEVGGLEVMKSWLMRKQKIFSNLNAALEFGVDMPKGVFIVGMPGCGKSLTAHATGLLFQAPLLRLDIGRLMGKYVGESEANMRKAIQQAEAISPCVLWVDEIEKAFSGIASGGSGSEVATRLFGQFLTWMQEKSSAVYVVATANDISRLPPELLRKGRFDETFYVGFPNQKERKHIFEIHLKKRKQKILHEDLEGLARMTKGYSGADIENIVKESVEALFLSNDKKINYDLIEGIVKETTSISEALKKQVEDYQSKYDQLKIKNASDN
jgi:SpoVK/Ycf46/Vps4 family AAA+-type ATPase